MTSSCKLCWCYEVTVYCLLFQLKTDNTDSPNYTAFFSEPLYNDMPIYALPVYTIMVRKFSRPISCAMRTYVWIQPQINSGVWYVINEYKRNTYSWNFIIVFTTSIIVSEHVSIVYLDMRWPAFFVVIIACTLRRHKSWPTELFVQQLFILATKTTLHLCFTESLWGEPTVTVWFPA